MKNIKLNCPSGKVATIFFINESGTVVFVCKNKKCEDCNYLD